MFSRKDRISALKESFTDTVIGAFINAPLNYVLIWIAFYFELTAGQTTALITGVIFFVALIRKYCIRLKFLKDHRRKKKLKAQEE